MKALRLSNSQKWYALAVMMTAMYIAFWSGLGAQSDARLDDSRLDVANIQTFATIDIQHDAIALETETLLNTANKALQQTAALIAAAPVQDPASDTTRTEAWQLGNHRAATPSIPLNERIVDYTVVEIPAHPAAYPQVGEAVELPMLNGEKVVANVESIVINPNGDYTWRGHMQGHGDSYPIVMTYGATSVLASITTPAGSYSMATVNGLGWLYKNPAEVELVDVLQNDFLEPPIDYFHDEH